MVDERQSPDRESQAAFPPLDPRLLAAIYGMAPDDAIDLPAYWHIVWGRRLLIGSLMMVAAIVSVVISLLIPNVYEAKVLMAPVNLEGSSNNSGKGLASALGGSLGGMAALAGISLGSTSSSEQNLAVLKSRAFLWSFVQDNKLMPVLFADHWDRRKKAWKSPDLKQRPTLWDAYRRFKRMLHVSTDKDSGLVTVAVDWTNPQLAADWANRLVTRLNDYLRQQAIARNEADLKYLHEALQRTSLADVRQALFTLIAQEQKNAMIANTQKQYAFEVLDAAAAPDRKFKPHRSIIVALSIFVTGFLSAAFVLIRERMQ